MTFHNVEIIERYFGTVLHIPPVWPTEPLGIIADWRNDWYTATAWMNMMCHVISAQQLQNALQKVYGLIDAANLSMRQEIDLFGDARTEENREIIASSLRISPDGDLS